MRRKEVKSTAWLDVIFIPGYKFAYAVIRKNQKLGNVIFRILDEGLFPIILELK